MDARITFSKLSGSKDKDYVHVTYSGRKKEALISVDSADYGNATSTKEECVLSTNTSKIVPKVSKSTEEIKQNHVGSKSVMTNPHFNNSNCSYSSAFTLEKPENEEKEAKSLILVRCDFKKSVKTHPYYPALTPFNRSTSLMNYFKEEQKCTLNQSNTQENNNMPCKSVSVENNVIDTSRRSVDIFDDVDDISSESPESRKKELCSYLQLMNPADKKEIYILQNRRSNRVRNLEVMQKQKKLRIESTGTDMKNSDIQERTKEMIVKIDHSEGETRPDTFCFPFPPDKLMKSVNDFDVTMSKVVPRLKQMCKYKNIQLLTDKNRTKSRTTDKVETTESSKADESKVAPKKTVNRKRMMLNTERTNSLRSKGKLKNVSLKKILRKKDMDTTKWKTQKQKELRESHQACREKTDISPKTRRPSKVKSVMSHCEIVTVPFAEENNDLDNFMEDFDSLSEEHRKLLIESRIFSAEPAPKKNTSPLMNDSLSSIRAVSPLYGFSKTDSSSKNKVSNNKTETCLPKQVPKKSSKDVIASGDKKSTPVYGNNTYLILNFHGSDPKPASKEKTVMIKENPKKIDGVSLSEHDYAGHPNQKAKKTDTAEVDVDVETVPIKNVHVGYLEVNTKFITKKNKFEILPHNKNNEIKSLHRSLQFDKKKSDNLAVDASLSHEWAAGEASPKQKSTKKQSHSITICKENGQVIKAFYVDYNLVVCQEYVISFWMQTPLGNILGSQDMWVPRGQTQRLVLNNKCTQKDSMEKVICTESSIVYIELWMKEHKSEMRQGPVADVFVALYFWKQRQHGLDKKVLQLENINGFADDVQYSVMKTVPKIIVSWHSANEDTNTKRTFIHAYQLAADFQTVSNIYDIEPVDHYVSSLHNIEDCDSLIMGCGENKITLWNVEFGYIVATIELSEIKSPLSTLWVKCDRGFLFALQQCVDRELRLVAINGLNHSWKKLASYLPPEGFDRLRGVCLENGLLLSFYDQGILCWKAETGEPVDEITVENDIIPSGRFVIIIEDTQIIVKHVVTHLMSVSVDES